MSYGLYSKDNYIQAAEKLRKIDDDDGDEICEPEDLMMLSCDVELSRYSGRGVCSSLEQRPKVSNFKIQGLWSGEEGTYLGFLRSQVSFPRNIREPIYGYTPTEYRDRDRIYVKVLSPGYNSICSL